MSRTVLERLAALLLERAGLKVNPEGFYSLRLALSARMPALGLDDAQAYLQLLLGPEGEQELRAMLPLVTVGHTEFFRDPRQFHALERRVLPDALRRARREGRKVTLWSAGCATGEEPYSLAILLHELGASPLEVDLWATDVNPAAVEAARQGRFSARRVGVLPPERLARYFREVEDGYEVQPLLKPYVRFGDHNLALPRFTGLAPGSLDLVLCRNVIIYFDLPTIRALMDRFLEALRPGGLLFLGYSESLFKVYEHFEMVEVEGAFVYRRPVGESPARRTQPYLAAVTAVPSGTPTPGAFTPAPGALTPAPRPPPAAARPTLVPATRVNPEAFRAPPFQPRAQAPSTPAPASAAPRTVTLELPVVSQGVGGRSPKSRLDAAARQMEKGDFAGALTAVQELTRDEPGDLDAWLTLGNLCSLLNRPREAREAFSQAIQREPLCVEARVFGGLAALQAGQLQEARGELGKALFLEPSLAVGHYLLAQVEERLGEPAAARRSYRNALTQLRTPQRPLAGHYPDMPDSPDALLRAARYALAALEEV